MSEAKKDFTPFFSVVIPLYNKEDTVLRALESVRQQTFNDFEVIVVNDGSTDNSYYVVEHYDKIKIKLLNQENKGVSFARNRGVEEAKAELIAFLDADDEWKSEYLQEMKNLVHEFPDAVVYGADFEKVLPDGRVVGGKDQSTRKICNLFQEWIGRQPIHTDGLIVRKKEFQLVGGFDVKEKYYEDVALIFQMALRYPVAITKRVLTRYHGDAKEFTTAQLHVGGQYIYAHHKVTENALRTSEFMGIIGLRKYAAFEARKILIKKCIMGDYTAIENAVKILPYMTRLVWERHLYTCPLLRAVGKIVGRIVILKNNIQFKMQQKTNWNYEISKLLKKLLNLLS